MTTKFGFTKMNLQEFEAWMKDLRIARTITRIQQHHTFSPDYSLFNGNNHFELQKGMKDYHVNHNGWMDMGQHFTIFPDGMILSGRSLELSPAGILGQNANSICIENLGNFDSNKDIMNLDQKDAIVKVAAVLCKKFNLPINTNSIVYHHWFNLHSGVRNNGSGNNKSCPGTAFFGGNKVHDCETNFLPLVSAAAGSFPVLPHIDVYVCVIANTLNIRKGPDINSSKVTDRPPAAFGAILRVYGETNGWLKISESKEHWVSKTYTREVKRATVSADALNVRNGPATTFSKIGSLMKGEEIFIVNEEGNWCKISMDEKWVSKDYLQFN